MTMTWQKALNGIANGERDYRLARGIFNGYDGADSYNETVTTAAARLADDMAEVFGAFGDIAAAKDYAGARVLASFGAMAAELRRLQDSEAELKRLNGAMQRELNDCTRRGAELESSLSEHAHASAGYRQRLALYREAAAQFTFGEMRDGAGHYRQLFEAYSLDVESEAAAERGDA